MTADAFIQILILAAEALVVCGLLLAFFSLRERFGNAPLYITLGGFQHLQTLMAATLYIEVFPGVAVSPGFFRASCSREFSRRCSSWFWSIPSCL